MQVMKMEDKLFYQSTPATYSLDVCLPIAAPNLSTYFSTCVDKWVASFQSEVTGRVVVDNAWQTVYEATCLHDGCGCTAFHRTEAGIDNNHALRCGEQDCFWFGLHYCNCYAYSTACEQVA